MCLVVLSSLPLVPAGAGALTPFATVTFWQNAPGPAIYVQQTSSVATNLQAFSTMGFTYSNHIFDGWNTQANGGGVTYTDLANYSFSTDIALYAQWTQDYHSVTFYANAFVGDPTDQNEVANSPTSLTAISKLGFTNPNHTFAGWNTQQNGSGVTFPDLVSYSFVSDLTLYAQWTLDNETLAFSSNSGAGSVAPITTPYGGSVTLPRGTSLSKANYSFTGWNTMPDGSGTQYNPGTVIQVQTGETLYASWIRDSYVVSFSVPGLKGKVAPITVPAGNTITLRPSSTLADPGFTFAGWYTAPVGGHFVGKGGASFRPDSSLTLYAHWTGKPFVSLEFSDNGGTGHITALTVHQGLAVIVPDGASLHRNGFTFRGWASSARASTPSARIGGRITLAHTKILYALWRRNLPASTPQVLLGSVGIFAPNSSALTPAMRHLIASLAIDIDHRNRTEVLIYGYSTSGDAAKGSAILSAKRALAVEDQLKVDLASLNDVGVSLRASGEARLTNSVLASFRDVEVFAN